MRLFSRIDSLVPSVSVKKKVEKDTFLSQEARDRGLIEEADKIEACMKRRIHSYADRADQKPEYKFLGYVLVLSVLLLILALFVALSIAYIALPFVILIAISLSIVLRKKLLSQKASHFSDLDIYLENKKKDEELEAKMRKGFEKGLFTWNPAPSSNFVSTPTTQSSSDSNNLALSDSPLSSVDSLAVEDSDVPKEDLPKTKKKPTIIFRVAEESDRTYIARLNFLTDVFGDETADISTQFLDDARYYVDEWSPSDGGFIAFDDQGIPAGGVWLRWGTEGWGSQNRHGYGHYQEGYPELAIAVEPRYQGLGVGKRLLYAAIDFAKEAKAPGISLCVDNKNPHAHRLYTKVGFQEHTYLEEEGLYVLFITFAEHDSATEAVENSLMEAPQTSAIQSE